MRQRIILILTLLIGSQICIAQQAPRKSKAERIQYFAKELSVNNEKAAALVEALDHNENWLREAVTDKSLKPKDKQGLIAKLSAEKRAKINALLSERQREVFNTLFTGQINRLKQYCSDVKQKNEAQLSKPNKGAILKRKIM